MSRVRRPTRTDHLVAKAISLAVHPAGKTTADVELLAEMAQGNATLLRHAITRLGLSRADEPSSVVEEAAFSSVSRWRG